MESQSISGAMGSPQYKTRDSWQETTASGHPAPSTISKSLEMEEKPLQQLQPFLDRLTVSSIFSIDQGVDFVEASGFNRKIFMIFALVSCCSCVANPSSS